MRLKLLTLVLTLAIAGSAAPAAQAKDKIPWGGVQISGTTLGTNCHLNKCWSGDGLVYVEASSFWGVVECGASIGLFIAGNAVLIGKARKAGGVYKVARRVWKAKSRVKKLEALKGFFGEITGLTAVIHGCS